MSIDRSQVSRRSVLAGAGSLVAATALAGCGRLADRATGGASPGTNGDAGTSTSSSPSASAGPAASTGPTAATATTTRTSEPDAPDPGADGYFPPASGPWETIDPEAAGWVPRKLEALATLVGESNSRTFLLLSGGRIVAERYWNGADEGTAQDVASVQKSVTSTLVGIAAERSLLSIDDPVSRYLPPGWSASGAENEAMITIRHLLTMSSGLNPRTLRKAAEPGTEWDYNTDAYQRLRPVLEAAAGEEINRLAHSWLFDTIGATSTAGWQERPGLPDATGARPWGLDLARARSVRREADRRRERIRPRRQPQPCRR